MPLRPDAGADRVVNAYRLARISKAIYHDDPAGSHPLFSDTFTIVRPFRWESVYGVVASSDSLAVVAFRGTDDNRDWLGALSAAQVRTPSGRVHSAVADWLDHVWPSVLAGLYDCDSVDKPIWLTGHSLGGGLALLAAMRLHEAGFDPAAVYTFGTPRVMDPKAVAAFPVNCVRVVNNEDAVPDAPWPSLLEEYAHPGERLLLTPSGAVAASRHGPWLARRIDRAMTIGEGPIRSGFIHDHMLDRYVEKLARLAGEEGDPFVRSLPPSW